MRFLVEMIENINSLGKIEFFCFVNCLFVYRVKMVIFVGNIGFINYINISWKKLWLLFCFYSIDFCLDLVDF